MAQTKIGGGWKGKEKLGNDAFAKIKGEAMSVRLIRGYTPVSEEYENSDPDFLSPGGKLAAGAIVALPKQEALRIIRLGIAEEE